MNALFSPPPRRWLAAALCFFAGFALADPAVHIDVSTDGSRAAAAASSASTASSGSDDDTDQDLDAAADKASLAEQAAHRHRRHRGGNEIVNVGHGSHLAAGEHADAVVSVFGSSTSEGDAGQVVSVFGSSRASGPVKEDVVSVFGDTYVDSEVAGDVVAVFGNVELGPHADVGGDVTAVGGGIQRDPAAQLHGEFHSIGDRFGGFMGMRTWFTECFVYARPLALVHGISWAWGLALGMLALYAFLALLFRSGIAECVRTFEAQPGLAFVAAILALLLTPILIALLGITVIGIPAIPFVLIALFCAGLFGKAGLLAWIGKRLTGGHTTGPWSEPVVGVLIGGVLMLALYVVPVLGLCAFLLFGMLGLGVAVYTLVGLARVRRAAHNVAAGGNAAPLGAAAPLGGADPLGGAAPLGGVPPLDTGAAPLGGAAPSGGAAPLGGTAPLGDAAPLGGAAGAASPLGTSAALLALPRAGFWIRMLALFIDLLLVGVVLSILGHHSHVQLVVLAAYGAVMWKLRGSTVGGIIFDLHVVRADGRPMDWPTATLRALSCFLSLAVAGLGFFWIAFDDNKQAWHDKIANTIVVRAVKYKLP
jgi:uncharacterized RDD family membrane protein YckC